MGESGDPWPDLSQAESGAPVGNLCPILRFRSWVMVGYGQKQAVSLKYKTGQDMNKIGQEGDDQQNKELFFWWVSWKRRKVTCACVYDYREASHMR